MQLIPRFFRAYKWVLCIPLAVLLVGCTAKPKTAGQPSHLQSKSHDSAKYSDLSDQSANQPIVEMPLPEADTTDPGIRPYQAFVRDGEAWLRDTLSGRENQATFTDHRIQRPILSPRGDFLACEKIVRWTDEPGEWGDKQPPRVPITQVMILQVPTGNVIRIVGESGLDFIYISEWISRSRLSIHVSSGFGVDGLLIFDAFRDSLQQVDLGYEMDQDTVK